MDQHLATVVIALISAATSLITIIIQRTSGAMYKKMKEGTSMQEDENLLRAKIDEAKRDIETTIYKMQILIVDMNMCMMLDNQDSAKIAELGERGDELKKMFNERNEELAGNLKEYEMVLKYNSKLQEEITKNRKNDNS